MNLRRERRLAVVECLCGRLSATEFTEMPCACIVVFLSRRRETLHHRQKDVEVVTKNLELERAKHHHLLTEVVYFDVCEHPRPQCSRSWHSVVSMILKFIAVRSDRVTLGPKWGLCLVG